MSKVVPFTFGVIGVATFAVSALRPELVGEAVRYLRWHGRWG